MEKLAGRLGADSEKWVVAGLLHDIDFEETKDRPDQHTLLAADILRKMELPEEIIEAIKGHNAEDIGMTRNSPFAIALTCAETITGLVVATALVMPDRKVQSVKPASVLKRMKSKDFARNVSRDRIRECEKLGLSLAEFVELSVRALQAVGSELGL